MIRQSGLGRGLDALIPAAGPGQSGLITLPVSSIVPNRRQPRGEFEERALEELAQSLRQVGLLQPVVVRPVGDGRYELIAGERRTRAARLAGLEEIPAVVRHTEDSQLLTEALVENIHRADLNPLEEAAAYQQLLDDFGMTHEALAERVGKSRPAISNALRLLTLPPLLQQKVAAGVLSAGHARALLTLREPAVQERIAQRVIMEGLSVRATEELVRSNAEAAERSAAEQLASLGAEAARRKSTPYRHLQERLTDALSTRVQISGDASRGRIVIDYSGEEDLTRLLEILGRGAGADVGQDTF